MKTQKLFPPLSISAALAALASLAAPLASTASMVQEIALAAELELDGELGAAAAARRRMALLEPDSLRAAGWFYLAATDYAGEGRFALSDKMLDRAEDSAPDALAIPSMALRAENAYRARDYDSADFYFASLRGALAADDADAADAAALRRLADYAAAGSAAAKLMSWDIDGAAALYPDGAAARAAILEYKNAPEKSPRLGGLLGVVPGLGYAYSGEYGNALRSLFLNSLFIWGMVEAGERDQWGAFSVLTFFELTWYTGSIYGGIDAAQRRNRERLDATIDKVRGPAGIPAPDKTMLPLIRLKFDLF